MPFDNCHVEDRGDGVLILVPATVPKSEVASGVPRLLADALAEHNLSHDKKAQIRLRMALHAGEVQFDGHGVIGKPINLAYRLLEADQLKQALADSSEPLAVIVSQWFYEEVIINTPACEPALYRGELISVKETRAPAWIYVPGCHVSQPDETSRLPAAVGADDTSANPTRPRQPPEGKLLQRARKRAMVSIREAARRAGISEGRWRQVESGYQTVARGVFLSSPAPAATIARMALVVDLRPEALEEAGRVDAAEELRELKKVRALAKCQSADLDGRIARLKANPKTRRRLEKLIDIADDPDEPEPDDETTD